MPVGQQQKSSRSKVVQRFGYAKVDSRVAADKPRRARRTARSGLAVGRNDTGVAQQFRKLQR